MDAALRVSRYRVFIDPVWICSVAYLAEFGGAHATAVQEARRRPKSYCQSSLRGSSPQANILSNLWATHTHRGYPVLLTPLPTQLLTGFHFSTVAGSPAVAYQSCFPLTIDYFHSITILHKEAYGLGHLQSWTIFRLPLRFAFVIIFRQRH